MVQPNLTLKSGKVIYLRKPAFKMSTSLCPHLFKEYSQKVGEIIITYKPQILAIVRFRDISASLLGYHVIKKSENEKILKETSETKQVEELLEIIKNRMWGLENFITVLIDRNIDTWLAEELFQSYVRHLVVNMKKIQAQNSCSCFQAGSDSRVYKAWIRALQTFDNYLNEIGSSLGFLTMTMHPVSSVLSFISDKLPLPKKKIVLTQCDDSDESEDETGIADDSKVASSSGAVKKPSLISSPRAADLVKNPKLSEKLRGSEPEPPSTIDMAYSEETEDWIWDEELDQTENVEFLGPSFQLPDALSNGPKNEFQPSLLNLSGDEIYTFRQIETTEGEGVVNSGNTSGPAKNVDYLSLDVPNDLHVRSTSASVYQSCSSLSDLEVSKTLCNLQSNEEVLNQMPSDLVKLVEKLDLISTCSETTVAPSTEFGRRHSAFESTSSFEFEHSNNNAELTFSEKQDVAKAASSQKKTSASLTARPKSINSKRPLESIGLKPLPQSISKEHSNKASAAGKARTPTSPLPTPSKPSTTSSTKPKAPPTTPTRKTFPLRNSAAFKESDRNPTTASKEAGPKSPAAKSSKVASITPRQRVLEDIRSKKANAPPPPPPVHEERLSPQDYNFQQWTNTRVVSKKRADGNEASKDVFQFR